MKNYNFDTLSQAVNTLTQEEGFTENFEAENNFIKALYSNRQYKPTELKILSTYRFEGMTNPGDQTTVFAIEAKDGTKGTMVMSNSAEHSQNVELIRQIPSEKD